MATFKLGDRVRIKDYPILDYIGKLGTIVASPIDKDAYSVDIDGHGVEDIWTQGLMHVGEDAIPPANQPYIPPGYGYVVKDSGKREEYESGMVRDTQEGKPDYTLLPNFMLTRWADHMTKGANKYGRRNWEKAQTPDELERFKSSAFRHLIQWLNGEQDEDHAAAVMFNIAAAEYTSQRILGWSDAI